VSGPGKKEKREKIQREKMGRKSPLARLQELRKKKKERGETWRRRKGGRIQFLLL